ncbi:MAG TPA: ATP-binding protein [Solimonas sp.]|nr:ATP-binding protein [Solimonas sp.]
MSAAALPAVRSPRLRTALLWGLIIGFWIGYTLLVEFAHRRGPPLPPLHTAELSLAGSPPLQVSLPHNWFDQRLQRQPWADYRIRVHLGDAGHEPQALYIESLAMDLRMQVNGVPIGPGLDDRDIARQQFRPQLFELPAPLLRAGDNDILIRVYGGLPHTSFLGKVWVGPSQELHHAYVERWLLTVALPLLLAFLALVTLMPTLLLAVWKQGEVYGWHAAAAGCFALYVFSLHWVHPPLGGAFVDWISNLLLGSGTLATTIFIMRYRELRRPRLERALGIAWLVGAVLLGLAAAHDELLFFRIAAPVWDVGIGFLTLYPCWLMLQAYWRLPSSNDFLLVLAGHILLIFGVHDGAIVNRLIPPWNGFFLPYAGPLPILFFFWILIRRFRGALQDSQMLTRELASRVEAKTAELRQSYEQQRELQEAQAVSEERSRILMDMHDGLGGQLMSTLARLENSGQGATPAAESVRGALTDLRLIIYSMEPSVHELRGALALLRDRLGLQCAGSGVELDWRMAALPEPLALPPRATLQVLRVVQEAVGNALKHARAGRIEVSAAETGGRVLIEIRDDGNGMPVVPARGGKGIQNMQRRALALGGELRIGAAEPGCRVSLSLPSEAPRRERRAAAD